MKLELPMVVAQKGARLVEAWLPRLGFMGSGPSLAELRDDLALQVMIALEHERPDRFRLYQLPPHLRLRQVDVKTIARDRDRNIKRDLSGRISVLLEKWPADDFWVATPARLVAAAFALRDLEALDGALARRLAAYSLEHDLPTLDGLAAARSERLDVLEVDADPPSILPRGVRPKPKPRRGKKKLAPGEVAETPAEREERRRRRRLTARVLREVGRNLSHGASDDTIERAFGREALVEEVAGELHDRDGVAVVLVGPSGVGKSAIVHEVTRRLYQRYQAAGQRRDVWRIDGGRFISGQSYVGQWEQRARNLIDELTETGDVLFADDLASLVYAGRTRAATTSLAQMLEPALARGEISILAESTPERLAKVREELPGFAALFRVIHVPPLLARETLTVLLGVLRDLESEAGAGPPPRLTPPALEAILDGAARFRPHEAFPGTAVRMLRRLCAGPGEEEGGVRRFDVPDVHQLVRAETGLPMFVVGDAPCRREQIRADLGAMVAGQPEALEAVTDVVLAMQASLGDPEKPLATLLLVGPTGVGKTETAKALAKYLFGSGDRLLRFDMSEFVTPYSLARFVGDAVTGEGGELTTALRSQPLRVILLDEIEKAHPRVFDALLQLLGEGRITDAAGRTADARQAVILMTSNLGVREAAARPGFVSAGEGNRQHYLAAVRAFFRPEMWNRIDRVVPYQPLDRPALRVVVEHALAELLSRRGIRQGNVLVDVEPALLDLLVEQAFDPRYGARPLRRALERRLTVPLARHLATRRGDDLALVEVYRAEKDLALAVTLLADAAPLHDPDPPAAWSTLRLAEQVRELGAEVTRLGTLPATIRLREARRRALAGEGPVPPGGELLDALATASEQLAGLDPEDLAGWQYREVFDESSTRDRSMFSRRYPGQQGHMGLRPRPAFVDIPLAADADATLRQFRPLVAQLRDEVAILAARLRGEEGEADERLMLVFEGVGVVPGGSIWFASALALHHVLPGPTWLELKGGWQPMTERDAVPLRELRRVAVGYEGPGLRRILGALVGYALLEAAEGVRHLVRITLVDGFGPEALPARSEPPPPVIVLRATRHVASGREMNEHAAIAAALVRGR